VISRENAKEMMFFSENWINNVVLKDIDRIYDSIGTCGECKHGRIVDTKIYCPIMSHYADDYYELDWFCADFERIKQ